MVLRMLLDLTLEAEEFPKYLDTARYVLHVRDGVSLCTYMYLTVQKQIDA